MKLFLFTVSILLLLISIEAFFPQSASSGIARRALFRQFSEVSTEPTTETSSLSSGDGNGDNKSASTGVWPGNRPPMMNEKLKLQRMSATWGRGRFRTEVWDDDVNPINNWWEAYAPSQEQLEAMAAGYDFSDSKSYFEVITGTQYILVIGNSNAFLILVTGTAGKGNRL